MLTFTVHEPPNPPADRMERAEALAFVRDGFSWSAALFSPVWLLAHRMWWPLLAYCLAVVAIGLVGEQLDFDAGWSSLAVTALNLLVGFEAHTLRRWTLARRGWTTIGAVSGRTADDCERRWFEMWLPAQPVRAPAAPDGSAPGSGVAAGGKVAVLGAPAGAQS
jgi:hypothetical protein